MPVTSRQAKPAIPEEYTVHEKFSEMRTQMREHLIERETEIDLLLTGLVCQESVLLVGRPGTAKSMLIDTMQMFIGGKKFPYLLTKFTEPTELFGPLDLPALKQGIRRHITKDKMPEADLVFLDELFKGSSAIRNTLLRMTNERIFNNGDGDKPIPMKMFLAASNEWPNEQDGQQEDNAFFDRILIRKKVEAIRTRAGKNKLRWEKEKYCLPRVSISNADLEEAKAEVMGIPYHQFGQRAFDDIVDEANHKGIMPGDRRIKKAVKACRAYAWLNGHDEVQAEDCEVLAHILWEDPGEQAETLRKIVLQIANPIGMQLQDILYQAEDAIQKNPAAVAASKIEELQKQVRRMGNTDQINDTYNQLADRMERALFRSIGREKE